MALMAAVKDGQIVESASQSSLNKANAKSTDGMDKDAFLNRIRGYQNLAERMMAV